MTRDEVKYYYRLSDAELAALPEVSRHNEPQAAPQQYECGCITITRVTDRRAGERPFEMRLAIACEKRHGCLVPRQRRHLSFYPGDSYIQDMSNDPRHWGEGSTYEGVLEDGEEIWREYLAACAAHAEVERRLMKAMQIPLRLTDEERAKHEAAEEAVYAQITDEERAAFLATAGDE